MVSVAGEGEVRGRRVGDKVTGNDGTDGMGP